jgi:hypothetical protein
MATGCAAGCAAACAAVPLAVPLAVQLGVHLGVQRGVQLAAAPWMSLRCSAAQFPKTHPEISEPQCRIRAV